MERRVSSPTFVGRAAELAVLDEAIGQASSGGPFGVIVGGEAGVGKSRLMREFTARADQAGVITLSGFCVPVYYLKEDADARGIPESRMIEAVKSVTRRDLPALFDGSEHVWHW